MLIDLHLHSTASDGTYTPAMLVREAAGRVCMIALTDHDSMDGVAEAGGAAEELGLAFLPGVELHCEGEREVHLLGYGLDAGRPAWRSFLQELQRERAERSRRMLRLLRDLGYPLQSQEVVNRPLCGMSRTHIARALVGIGAAGSIKEAFQRFLTPGRPAYAPRSPLSMRKAIRLMREADGIPVLAHPGLLALGSGETERNIRAWRNEGLMGVEAFYPRHTVSQTASFARLAAELGMLVTGGSDAHGEAVRSIRIGEGLGGWTTRKRDAQAIWRAAAHKTGVLRMPRGIESSERGGVS